MLEISKRLLYYKRKDIQKAILSYCQNRELGVKYNDFFGKRPDVVFYENEIFNFVKKGATSFHVSEERWQIPLELSKDLKKNEIDDLRIGWDLVLDIDCPFWLYSKISTYLFIKALKQHGINSISCKFSGNKGFHVGVPFEAFPEYVNNVSIKNWYPDGAKKIALYLVDYVSKNFIKYKGNEIYFDNIHKTTIQELMSLTEKSEKELIVKKCSSCNKTKCVCGKNDYKDYFDSLSLINLDTLLISPRHLFRVAFSINEKSGLVSIPLPIGKVLVFDKKEALPEKVFPEKLPIFLDSSKVIKNEAEKLIIAAFDYDKDYNINLIETMNNKNNFKNFSKSFDNFNQNEIPQELFPPCILKILQGLEDGKKRSLFVLINFLSSVYWSYDKIENILLEWNKKNKEPLKESLIKLQLKYHIQKKQKFLPPNCRQYYQDFGVCNPDNLCEKIKNPVQYSKRKSYLLNLSNNINIKINKKKGRQKLTEEQKEMRRNYRERLKKEKEKNNKEN